MNASVASYMLLLVSSSVLSGVSFHKLNYCVTCVYRRNYKASMLSGIICAAWSLVALNGIWVKWQSPESNLVMDTPIFIMLVCATLYALVYSLHVAYKQRCKDGKQETRLGR